MMNQIKEMLEDAMYVFAEMYVKDLNRTKKILKLQ